MHFFNEFICDWLGDVYDSCILFLRCVNETFKTFRSLHPLDNTYENYEKFGSFYRDQSALGFHNDIGYYNFNIVGIFDLHDSDGSQMKI